MRRAFTLVEIAIVLFIVTILLSFGIFTFGNVTKSKQFELTKQILQKLKVQSLTYVTLNGRLPCPDIDCDGIEDRCKKSEGCDLDEDGVSDLEFGACLASFYQDDPTKLKNAQCGDMDFARGINIPPYLLPAESFDVKRGDPFGKPLRYDVNFLLATAPSLDTFCAINAFLGYNKEMRAVVEDEHLLPIATDMKDTSDDEKLVPEHGTSIAAIFISQTGCNGVSGKNAGANREYAAQSVDLGPEADRCTPDTYHDLTATLFFHDLSTVCQGHPYPKRWRFFLTDADQRSFDLFVDGDWVCYNMEDLGYGAESGMVWWFGIERNLMRFYEEPDCDGDPIWLEEIVAKDKNADGAVGLDEELQDRIYVTTMLEPKIAAVVLDDNGNRQCVEASNELKSLTYAIDAHVDEIAFYKSLDDCKNEAQPLALLSSIWLANDRNRNGILYVGADGVRDDDFTIYLTLGENTSYFEDGRCFSVESEDGTTLLITQERNFVAFNKPDCSADAPITVNDILYTLFVTDSEGNCMLEEDGDLRCQK